MARGHSSLSVQHRLGQRVQAATERQMMKKLIVVLCTLSLAGCATPVDTTYRPVVDTKGVDMNAFERDLVECRQFANETWNAQQGAASGAIAGALFGAAIGAVLGVRGSDLARIAGATAITGGASGAGQGYRNQTDIVKNCLAMRGYRVLGG
jgi:outer membrane lipoprotein SlyB